MPFDSSLEELAFSCPFDGSNDVAFGDNAASSEISFFNLCTESESEDNL